MRLALIFLLVSFSAIAQPTVSGPSAGVFGFQPAAATSPCGVLFCENFDSWTNWARPAVSPYTTNVNNWSLAYWNQGGGAPLSTISNAAIAATLGMEGTTVLQMIDPNGDEPTAVSPSFTAQSEFWLYLEWRCTGLATPASGNQSITFLDAGSNKVAYVNVTGAGAVQVANGTANLSTSASVVANTLYYLWIHYKAGTGANGIADVGWNSVATRPTSGTQYAQVTSGTSTTSVTAIKLVPGGVTSSSFYFDKIRVYSGATPPPDNQP